MTSEAFDDVVPGALVYEVDVLLSPSSGRAKHADPVEQGYWISFGIERGLRSVALEGMAFGSIRYLGEGRVDRAVLDERQIGPAIGPFQVDKAHDHVGALKAIIWSMSEVVMRLVRGVARCRGNVVGNVGMGAT